MIAGAVIDSAIVLRTMEQMETKEAQMFSSWKNCVELAYRE